MKFITKTPEELVQMALDIADNDAKAYVLIFTEGKIDKTEDYF